MSEPSRPEKTLDCLIRGEWRHGSSCRTSPSEQARPSSSPPPAIRLRGGCSGALVAGDGWGEGGGAEGGGVVGSGGGRVDSGGGGADDGTELGVVEVVVVDSVRRHY